jgi:hypothetical protein
VPDKGGAVSEDGKPLACTFPTPTQISCPIGTIARRQFRSVEISLVPTPAAAIGQKTVITVSATPDEGTDTNPKNNTISGDVFLVGPSHLTTTVTPAAPTVTVGKSVTLSISVHNDGPDTAYFAVASFLLGGFDDPPEKIHFTMTGLTGRGTIPLDCPPDSPEPCTFAEWLIPTLAAGETVTAHLTVKATSAGTTPLSVNVGNPGSEPQPCTIDSHGNKICGDQFPLTAVAAPTTTPPSPQSSGPQLAATGATPWPLTWLGSSMVLLGAALLRLARPKRRRA